MNGREQLKLAYLICGTFISSLALILGYDGKLALYSVLALFGGEKVLDRLFNKKKE